MGGRTGRDGIHGVTFASAELSARSEDESRGAVQLGDPIMKEPTIHACLEVNEQGLVSGIKDLGRRRAVLRGRGDRPGRRMRRGGPAGQGAAEGGRAWPPGRSGSPSRRSA